MPKISIVIPVYNVEKYINQCLDSVIYQTVKDIEIILVDDGSTDKSGIICDDYAKKDSRVKVVHKKNGGVSSARNTGLEICNGEWITFLDPDDWLELNALEVALNQAQKYNVDIIGWNHYYNNGDKQFKREEIFPDPLIRKNEEIKGFILDTMYPKYDKTLNNISVAAIRGVWGKLFKRDLIMENNIRFDENLKIAEDALFCILCFKKASKIILVNQYLSHYRVVNQSANRRYREDINEINKNILDIFYKYIQADLSKEGFLICYMGLACECLCNSLDKYFVNPMNPNGFLKRIKDLKELTYHETYQRAFNYKISKDLGTKEKIVIYAAKKHYAFLLYVIFLLKRNFNNFKTRLVLRR